RGYGYGAHRDLLSFPTRRSSDLRSERCLVVASSDTRPELGCGREAGVAGDGCCQQVGIIGPHRDCLAYRLAAVIALDQHSCASRSEEHTSELQSRENLVCRLLLE